MGNSNSNGHGVAVIDRARMLPVNLVFAIAGTELTAEYSIDDKGVARYKRDAYFGVEDPGADREELLTDLPIEVEGTSLVAGEKAGAHQSMPRLYGKGHEKAGQVIPGKEGGNWTIKKLGLVDIDGRAFTVTCQVTILDRADDRGTEARASFTATERKLKTREIVGTI